MLKQELLRRNLPALPETREEMIAVIKERLFGELPSPAFSVSVSEPTVIYDGFADQDYPLFRLEENNTPYIFFYTDDGTGRLYALTPEQYDEILEVLE